MFFLPPRTHGGGSSLSPTGWREARTEALDLVCLMNNSVKAKAAEASLVRTLTSVEFVSRYKYFAMYLWRWDCRRNGRVFSPTFASTAMCHIYLGSTGFVERKKSLVNTESAQSHTKRRESAVSSSYPKFTTASIVNEHLYFSFRLASRRFIQELFLEVDFSR